jgi:transcriptional regulator with GAF, ATPase, and Fis domain
MILSQRIHRQRKAQSWLWFFCDAHRHIVSQLALVAPPEASVLILGETGMGKELVAREIHLRSARKDGQFVRVNCASIPRELFESEFFGHVRGSGHLLVCLNVRSEGAALFGSDFLRHP